MADRICSIPECDHVHYAKGWCNKHWRRWRKHGDPGVVVVPHRTTCTVDGCETLAVARGWCSMHYQRWEAHGDPLVGGRQRNVCSVIGCAGLCIGRGWCEKHYRRWETHGHPLVTARIVGDIVARFEMYLSLGPIPEHAPWLGPCWIWTGGLDPDGYCKFRAPGEQFAYRWSFTFHVGPIPEGLELDHLCRVRACANPWHLDPVTQAVNKQRANAVRWGTGAHDGCDRSHLEVAGATPPRP